MSTITLKSLLLVNFKGVRELRLDFTQQVTVISGENGTGKTTIFDAFHWLLFGKDSTGRSDSNFNIKTIDPSTKKPILHLEHSVTAMLDVDGREVKIQRCYCEKWSRATANAEERLINHYTEFYINDVKMGTKREFDSEIAEIIPEDVFKLVTNPYYFVNLKAEQQKAILLEMVGTVSDEEVAGSNETFVKLLAELNGRSLAAYAKEVAAKKRACNDELKIIPSKIDTANRLRPQPENWEELESQKTEKEKRLQAVEDQIRDRSMATEAEYKRKSEIQRQIGEKRLALNKAENEIRTTALSGINQAKMDLQKLQFDLSNAQATRSNLIKKRDSIVEQIAQIESVVVGMREEYKRIFLEKMPPIPEGTFVCPTCNRPLEAADINAKKAELEANFNGNKSQRLKANEERGKKLIDEQSQLKNKGEEIRKAINQADTNISTITAQVEAKKTSIPEAPNVDAMIQGDAVCQALRNEISDLENQLTMNVKTVDVSDLTTEKTKLQGEIRELERSLLKRDAIERADKEINELEEKRIANNQALASLEGWELVALEFQKAKDAKLQEKIDSLFSYVSFSFIKEQLNGNENVTCVCTVNGTPYPDVNAAGKLNAGLDIINAVCKHKGVSAPIFIDNRESVNQIIPTISQVINLCVSLDAKITIR